MRRQIANDLLPAAETEIDMKPEDFLLDDTFLAWYFRSDDEAWLRWEELRKKDPVLRAGMNDAVRIIEAVMAGHAVVDPEQRITAHARLMKRIHEWEQAEGKPLGQQYIGRRRFLWAGVAASVALLVLAVGYWLFTGNSGENTYFAEAGSTKRIELPDGSVVDLNGNSSLKTHFVSGEDREVWLTGEAYFKVSKQVGGEKFIVHSGDLDVEVLGTEFNVRGYDEKTEVVLESGKVQVSRAEASGLQDKILMAPGEMAEFSKSVGTLTKRDVNTRVYTSWKEGKVIFENASLDEIAEILKSRYDLLVEIEEGSVLGEFNGIFPSDNPEIVVTALQKTYAGKIVRKDSGIVFKK